MRLLATRCRGCAPRGSNTRAARRTSPRTGGSSSALTGRSTTRAGACGSWGRTTALLAIVFGYACHNTTLQDGFVQYHGDYAGVAQAALETRHPGATALFMIGCGADANPKPRGTIELVQAHGTALADAVDRVLPEAAPIAPALHTAYGTVDLPFADAAARERWQRQLDIDEVYLRRHAALMEETITAGRPACRSAQRDPIQVWRFGRDLALIGLGGEVVVDYAIRLPASIRSSGSGYPAIATTCSVRAVSPRPPRRWIRRRRRHDLLRPPGAVHRRGRGPDRREGPPADARLTISAPTSRDMHRRVRGMIGHADSATHPRGSEKDAGQRRAVRARRCPHARGAARSPPSPVPACSIGSATIVCSRSNGTRRIVFQCHHGIRSQSAAEYPPPGRVREPVQPRPAASMPGRASWTLHTKVLTSGCAACRDAGGRCRDNTSMGSRELPLSRSAAAEDSGCAAHRAEPRQAHCGGLAVERSCG